jgi:hypothetical protein
LRRRDPRVAPGRTGTAIPQLLAAPDRGLLVSSGSTADCAHRAHPVRERLVSRLGLQRFLGLYWLPVVLAFAGLFAGWYFRIFVPTWQPPPARLGETGRQPRGRRPAGALTTDERART